jgi:hypothetical protein
MLGAVIRSHADLALGFTFWPDDFVAAPDRAQMYEPVPLPCESRGFAALSLAVARPTRSAGPVGPACKPNLNMHFYLGPAWLLVPVPGRRPDRLSACRLVTGAVSPAGACCLLNRRCGPFRVTSPTAPGIGVGAPWRTPTRLGGRARARLRQGEDQAQPSSPGRGLSPGQSQSSSVAGACHSTLFP